MANRTPEELRAGCTDLELVKLAEIATDHIRAYEQRIMCEQDENLKEDLIAAQAVWFRALRRYDAAMAVKQEA